VDNSKKIRISGIIRSYYRKKESYYRKKESYFRNN